MSTIGFVGLGSMGAQIPGACFPGNQVYGPRAAPGPTAR